MASLREPMRFLLLGLLLVAPSQASAVHRLLSKHRLAASALNSTQVSHVARAAAGRNSTAAAAAAAAALRRANTSARGNATVPFSARVEPAVGKVFALYYSSYSGAKATSVESRGHYQPATRRKGPVWLGGSILPEPTCGLQLTSQTKYPTENRIANLRLSELAVCQLLEWRGDLPKCGAGAGQVCELSLLAPLPSNDDLQEPFIGAAMALAAYSELCALRQDSAHDSYKCAVHRSMSAICAGLGIGAGGKVQLKGLSSPGQLDLKLDDAYILNLQHVYLAKSSQRQYEETKFYRNTHDVLKWQHAPPEIHFCSDLACLTNNFLPPSK